MGVPISLFVGEEDILTVPKDVRWMRDNMPNVVYYKEIDGYDHSSFLFYGERDLWRFYNDFEK